MNLYDRYLNKIVSEKDLPNQIDFGRYYFLDNGNPKDITYSNYPTNKTIRQELLLDKNKGLQDIFIDIFIDAEKSENDNFDIIPLIRRIKNKLGLNDFETLLDEEVFHLEEIFRVPHYLLEREIEKVHVSRAKRIPSKSYQHLASHTEDWVHKSIVNFTPSRILNEELELNYDIYENQLTIAFIERCLVYLNSRLKEVQDIKSFLTEYEKLLKNRNDQKGWYKKINRNLSLIGSVYEDDHFNSKIKDGSTLSKTEEILNRINKRFLALRKRALSDSVNKRAIKTISLRNTNVLVNHKHYRYVKSLWIELDKVKPEKSEVDKNKFEQDVLKGVRAYGKSLITYTLSTSLEFELLGDYKNFSGQHLLFKEVKFNETKEGVLKLEIGNYKIKIVIVGNDCTIDKQTLSLLESQHTYILYYDEKFTSENSRLIRINPLDPDSVERVGTLMKKYLLMSYLDNIREVYEFKHLLKEYIKYIPRHFLEFSLNTFTYNYHSYPKVKLSVDEIMKEIENDQLFKTKSRPDKEIILNSISELLTDIETNSNKLKVDYLNCFNCGEILQAYNVNRLNYIQCTACLCLIDSSNIEKVILKINDTKYSTLSLEEFGMDALIINKAELWDNKYHLSNN